MNEMSPERDELDDFIDYLEKWVMTGTAAGYVTQIRLGLEMFRDHKNDESPDERA